MAEESVAWEQDYSKECDPYELCASNHKIMVGIVKKGDIAKPFEDYFVVGFAATDTSGGGKVMEWMTDAVLFVVDAGKAGLKVFTDPKDYYTTVTTGFGGALADISREQGVVYGEGVVGNVAVGVKKTGDAIVGAGSYAKKKICGKYNPLCAETDYALYAEQEMQSSPFYAPQGFNDTFHSEDLREFRGVGNSCGEGKDWDSWAELTGGCFHPVEANRHKIRITITNEFEGISSTPYVSDLAGCAASFSDGKCDTCCSNASFKRFLINKPGNWTITVTPVASASCCMPSYSNSWTFNIPTPDGWKPNEIEAMSTNVSQVLQDAGLPVYLSPVAIVGVASLLGGFLIYKIYKKKKMKS